MSLTPTPEIFIIEEDYEIPQLKKRRRIAAILPANYHQSEKFYPVLYLHDGQNLFNEHSPFGNWAIDKSLEKLNAMGMGDLIVITIDHGGEDRVVEYLPFATKKFGEGMGRVYLQFLMETLKPYVDKKFRVLTGSEHTGIGGSSMGGLISLYAGFTMPDIFGKLMIFSPSLWTSHEIFETARKFQPKPHTSMYLYAGGKESRHHLPNIRILEATMRGKCATSENFRFHLSINPEGTHSEPNWGAEFPHAVEWLYFINA